MNTLPKLLVVDDDLSWLEQVPIILEDDCEVDAVATVNQSLLAVERESYDIVLLDLNFENDSRNGLDVFRKIHALDRGIDVIVISGETHPQRLIEVFNAGVTRFISKPATPDRIRQEVRQVLEIREARKKALSGARTDSGVLNPLTGISGAIRKAQQEVELLIKAGAKDILIQGETGTGKELLARYLAHRLDRSGRFIPIHCGAIADGLIESELFGHVRGAFTGADRARIGAFEAAGGGFVFLDELGEMPPHQQAKLLRVLQERVVQRVGSSVETKVNFRTISATHVDLEASVLSKKFREDLYYRIAKARVVLPPLRERMEDIPQLVELFLCEAPKSIRKDVAPGALRLLQSYSWPGNIRQLKAVVETLQARSEDRTIREKDVCAVLPEITAFAPPGLTRQITGVYTNALIEAERKKFEKAILLANGDRDQAAKILGLSRATYFRRARELGLVANRRSAKVNFSQENR